MRVKQLIILYGCCCYLLLSAVGCRSQTETVQQQTTTTQQSSSTQASAANSNVAPVAQNVALNGNVTAQNSNTTPTQTAQTAQRLDPCSLLTPSEIASVQGEEVKDTKAAPGNSNRLAVSQCFYQTATPVKSVSLELTQRLSGQTGALSPREFWKESFEGADRERERERERKEKRAEEKREARREGEEEEQEGNPPRRITGVGDEAFWAGNVRAGALYVLKGNSIIRISIGGIADQGVRLEKTKALARLALKRLKD